MRKHTHILSILAIAVCFMIVGSSAVQLAQTSRLPDQLTDQEFWRLITDLSEPSGPYTGDNWISNEASIQNVIPPLRQMAKPGGVYLGVGPEQNFTYMWALQSKIGFIIDIRRQNMLEILMLKALFEVSPDRADFVANLFSRRRPAGLDVNTNAKALMTAFASSPSEGLAKNQASVKATLAKHGYTLSTEDLARISFVQEIFNRGGVTITAEFSAGFTRRSSRHIHRPDDRHRQERQPWSFLSSEAAYQYIREMHRKNLIIPLVGDFAGPSTIRRVGEYLKQRNANVAAFYLSNVEYYLNGPTMKAFQSNVASLPIDSSSTLIRWSPRPTVPYLPWYAPDMGVVVSLLTPASELVDLVKANQAPTTYRDVLSGTRDPQTLTASMQDPSLRRVTGRITGISGLKPNEILRVELVENLRPAGLIVSSDVAADGTFEIRNVAPRTYQAIVLRGCKGCSTSRVAAAPLNVVVADKDIIDVRLALIAQ